MGISLVDVTGVAGALGGVARDIRAAITGKEVLTAEERDKVAQRLFELEKIAQEKDVKFADMQAQINLADANSGSNYRGGWRPMVGWICAGALAYQFILRNILPWSLNAFGLSLPAMPELDGNTLMTLLGGLLGLGGFRTFEKVKGVQ